MIVLKQYDNQLLLQALEGEKELIQSAEQYLLTNDSKYDDEQRIRFEKFLALPQFERDLLYLSTRLSIAKIAELYAVTSSYIYIRIKKINQMLK